MLHRPSPGVVVPPISEQGPSDVHKHAGNLGGTFFNLRPAENGNWIEGDIPRPVP